MTNQPIKEGDICFRVNVVGREVTPHKISRLSNSSVWFENHAGETVEEEKETDKHKWFNRFTNAKYFLLKQIRNNILAINRKITEDQNSYNRIESMKVPTCQNKQK